MKTTKTAMRGAMIALAMFTAASAADAAELTHRWSFNGDYADSVGGSTATEIGSAVRINGGQVELRGSGNGAGSLNMGSNLLDASEATVEIWATQRSVKNWARVFDYGPDLLVLYYFNILLAKCQLLYRYLSVNYNKKSHAFAK